MKCFDQGELSDMGNPPFAFGYIELVCGQGPPYGLLLVYDISWSSLDPGYNILFNFVQAAFSRLSASPGKVGSHDEPSAVLDL